MKEKKHLAHKKRKWVCPSCGRVAMQRPVKERKKRGSETSPVD